MSARVKLYPHGHEIIGPKTPTGMRQVCLVWHDRPTVLVCIEDDKVPAAGLWAGLPVEMDLARSMLGYRDEVVA